MGKCAASVIIGIGGRMEERKMNLKELKDILNKIKDDETLKMFKIGDKIAGFEDPVAEIGLVFFADDDNDRDKCFELFETDEMQQISKFADKLWIKSKQMIAAGLDEDLFEQLCEQQVYEEEK